MGFEFVNLKDIGDVVKNSRERVVVSVCEVNRAIRADCRIHFFDSTHDMWKPSPKGMNLDLAQTNSVIALLQEAAAIMTQMQAERDAAAGATPMHEQEQGDAGAPGALAE